MQSFGVRTCFGKVSAIGMVLLGLASVGQASAETFIIYSEHGGSVGYFDESGGRGSFHRESGMFVGFAQNNWVYDREHKPVGYVATSSSNAFNDADGRVAGFLMGTGQCHIYDESSNLKGWIIVRGGSMGSKACNTSSTPSRSTLLPLMPRTSLYLLRTGYSDI